MENTIKISEDVTLERYIPDLHTNIIEALENDSEVSPYLKVGNELYILKYKGEYAGFYIFYRLGYLKNAITMQTGLVKEFRSNIKTNKKGIGSEVLKQVSDYLLANEADNLVLEIDYRNVPSIKAAVKNGYIVDESLQQKFYEEGYENTPYVKGK